jgi:hypothetical protein
MISPHENEAASPDALVKIQVTNSFRFEIEIIFTGTLDESHSIAQDSSQCFKSVLRDILLARMPVERARKVAVRAQFIDFLGHIPYGGCLKDHGFHSIIE